MIVSGQLRNAINEVIIFFYLLLENKLFTITYQSTLGTIYIFPYKRYVMIFLSFYNLIFLLYGLATKEIKLRLGIFNTIVQKDLFHF